MTLLCAVTKTKEIITPFEPKVEAQRSQRTMSSEKVIFFLHVYFHYENKKKHIGNAKFGNYARLSASSASSA
jgi:hypothetical protein